MSKKFSELMSQQQESYHQRAEELLLERFKTEFGKEDKWDGDDEKLASTLLAHAIANLAEKLYLRDVKAHRLAHKFLEKRYKRQWTVTFANQGISSQEIGAHVEQKVQEWRASGAFEREFKLLAKNALPGVRVVERGGKLRLIEVDSDDALSNSGPLPKGM